MKDRALITGIAGQDGSYLAELLLEKGYDVYGLVRYSTTESEFKNIKHIRNDIKLLEGDITDGSAMHRLIGLVKPHEIYNLAAQSHVGKSFEIPELTTQVTGVAFLKLLEAVRKSGFNSKIYQASTSELFGNSTEKTQNEQTSFVPVSPYGCAKLYAHHVARNYREAYNMFVCCGILFNHESPRRGPQFVTRKITRGAAQIARGELDKLGLGNMDARRDWGHARDYVRGMWMMMQHGKPDDYVLATGATHSVRDFAEEAFKAVGLDYREYVFVDPKFYRPTDVNTLVGDATKARDVLGWEPQYSFSDLVSEMVEGER